MSGSLYLTIPQLADRLGVPVETLKTWSKAGIAPKKHKFGQLVRYLIKDVEAWEEKNRED